MTVTLAPLNPNPATLAWALQFIQEASEWESASPVGVSAEAVLGAPNAVWLEAKNGDELLGIVGLHTLNIADRSGSPAVGIVPKWRGKGLYRLLAQGLEEYAFQTLNLRRLETRAVEGPTTKVFHRIGWKVEAKHPKSRYKNGQYVDTFTLSRVREE
jgi:RimJ/RimL family protein N-acetyltransferase